MTTKRAYRRQAKRLSAVQAAYIAGYVDGEGCISARVHRGGVYGVLEVSSTNLETLQWLCCTSDVGVVQRKSRKRLSSNHRMLYVWRVSICSLSSLLAQLLPYLRGKKRQAELMLELTKYDYPSRLEDDFQVSAVSEFRLLNARGLKPVEQN